MKKATLFIALFLAGCDGSETKNKIMAVDAGQGIPVSADVNGNPEEVAINQGEDTRAFDAALNESSGQDFSDTAVDSAMLDTENIDEVNVDADVSLPSDSDVAYISCGDVGNCPLNFVCIDQNLCCPDSLPQECGGQCFPDNCDCVEDGEFTFCLPDNMEYCGQGVSCLKNECYLAEDADNYYCVSADQEYCGNGVVCNVYNSETCKIDGDKFYCIPQSMDYCGNGLMCQKNKENCVNDDGKYYCVAKGYYPCEEEGKVCADWQVCTENSCCPKEQPIECGQTCCYPDEPCVDAAKSVCQPKGGTYCNGMICVAGEVCALNGVADCWPANADFCDDGRWCPPGSVCSIGEKGDCCPQGQPQRCGKVCCPENYDCVETDFGKKCIYPGGEPCGDGWCEPDEFCADGLFGICAEDGSELCDDGHICEPGAYCAGPTCCSMINANQNCGMLCCSSNWQCLNGGEACIPAGATYLGNGKYCGVGTFFNEENGNCDPIGWKPCGSGAACMPGTECSKDQEVKTIQCCQADQTTLCGDKCCYTGFQCFHDGAKNVCLPPSADYCWGTNVNEWCPPATECGKKGKKCIPVGAMECENGDFCPLSEKCTESAPACCPWAVPVPCVNKCCGADQKCKTLDNGEAACCKTGAVVCGDICCPIGFYCEEYNGTKTCFSKDVDVCQDTIMNDTLCDTDKGFCEADGACLDNDFKGKDYDYCGGGKACGNIELFSPSIDSGIIYESQCAGLCADFCCDGADVNESCTDFASPTYSCQETKTSFTCCKTSFSDNTKEIEKQNQGKCKNIKCEYKQKPFGNFGDICCTYDKATPAGCVNGCIPDGQVCYDIPVSNSNFDNPIESGLYPNEVPNEIGSYCDDADYLAAALGILSLGVVTFDIYFIPVGFDPKFYDGVYHVEEGDGDNGNWISGNPGDEIVVVEDVWVVDNLEGNDCPHGPYAQFYVLIHKKGSEPTNIFKPMLSSILNNTVYGNQVKFLKGPFSGAETWKFCFCYGFGWLGICIGEDCINGGFETGAEQEWVDYLKVRYPFGKAGVYKWEKDEEKIFFTLRERDGSVEKYGISIIRWDDFMGLQAISKKATKKSCGQTIDLMVYRSVAEDDDPNNDGDLDPEGNPYYYKTNKVGARIKFRTIICTGKAGDPC